MASLALNTYSGQPTRYSQSDSMEDNANGWVKKGVKLLIPATSTLMTSAQYGSRSLKIVTTATIGDGASYSVPSSKLQSTYTLSAWVKLLLPVRPQPLILTARTTALMLMPVPLVLVSTCLYRPTWTQFTCTFTTGATVNGNNQCLRQTDQRRY